jgi:hypothetical protein
MKIEICIELDIDKYVKKIETRKSYFDLSTKT